MVRLSDFGLCRRCGVGCYVDTVMELVSRFAELYSFPLDDYQLAGCQALANGSGVLVAAPTGAGKTVVG